MKKPKQIDEMLKFLNKQVEVEIGNGKIIGRFANWDKKSITIENIISNEPYRVQMKNIPIYIIKHIKIIEE